MTPILRVLWRWDRAAGDLCNGLSALTLLLLPSGALGWVSVQPQATGLVVSVNYKAATSSQAQAFKQAWALISLG